MPGVKPVILLYQGPPITQPSVVLEFAVVGLGVILQTSPLTVTVPPPFEVIFPPPVAVVVVILVAGDTVVRVGADLFSEQEAVVPPLGPRQVQVQVVELWELLALVPTLQL